MRDTKLLAFALLLLACGSNDALAPEDGGVRPDASQTSSDAGPEPTGGFNFETTLYIDGSLSDDCPGQYEVEARSCGAGTETAYASFATATAAAIPGDHFLIRDGSYSEVLKLAVSGTEMNYIGYSAFEEETVAIEDVDSIDGGENYGPIWLDHVSFNLVEGMTVTGSVGFLRGVDSHHNVINDCNFDTSTLFPGGSKRGGLYFAWSSYNKVLNSSITRGTDSLSLVHSDHNLIAGNTFDLAGHDIWSIKCSSFNVVRGNHISNPEQKLGSVFDCEEATTNWHGNGEFAEDRAILNSTKHNLIEGNVFRDAVDYYSTSGGNGIQHAGQSGVVRNNIFYATNVGIGMAHYAEEALYNEGNRVFNNVFHDNRCGALALAGGQEVGSVADNEYKNNILWDNKGWDEDCAGTSPAQILYRAPFAGHAFVRNNIASSLGDTVIRAEFGSESSIGDFSGSDSFTRTLALDPRFVDEAAHDYHVQADSPMVDAGDFLTIVVSRSGTGAELAVADARYFYDGYGIGGEVGDRIQLEGQTETATIVAIDYESNIIALDRELTWTEGAGIGRLYKGAAPDLGAFEYE